MDELRKVSLGDLLALAIFQKKSRERQSRSFRLFIYNYLLFYEDYVQNAATQAARLTLTALIATRYCSGDIW